MPESLRSFIRQWLPRGGWLAAAVVAVGLMALSGAEVLRIVAALTAGSGQPVAVQQQARSPDLLRHIVAAHLFGAASGRAGGDSGEPPPETSLQLTLRGVFAGSSAGSGSAIIETQAGVTRSIEVGRSIDRDTRLHAVHPDHVVLDRGGQLESLYFPELDGIGSRTAGIGIDAGIRSQLPAGIRTRAADGSGPASSDNDSSAATAMSSDERREMIRQRLEELRQRAASNRNLP